MEDSAHSVLVVEDEPMVARALSFLLEDMGLRCRIASTGAEAIAAAESAGRAVALVDLNLAGGMDGIETAAVLRRRFGISCILASGVVTQEIKAHAAAAGAARVLQKPFAAETLKAALNEAMAAGGP